MLYRTILLSLFATNLPAPHLFPASCFLGTALAARPFLHPLCTRIRPTYRSLHEHVILCHISFALTALAPVTLSTPYNFNPHSPLFPLPPFHFSHSQPSVPSLSSLLCPRRPQSPLAVDHILCSLRPPPLPRITPLSPRSPPTLPPLSADRQGGTVHQVQH